MTARIALLLTLAFLACAAQASAAERIVQFDPAKTSRADLMSGLDGLGLKSITLRKLLSELPEQRRTVFSLFEIEGLSHAEIAGILDITEGNSKWILFSTKKQLQEQWKKAAKS